LSLFPPGIGKGFLRNAACVERQCGRVFRNFEVSEGKVYKGASCQSLGSNWERIESAGVLHAFTHSLAYLAATGKELKGFLHHDDAANVAAAATGKELKVPGIPHLGHATSAPISQQQLGKN
jgi:hypothetical protein